MTPTLVYFYIIFTNHNSTEYEDFDENNMKHLAHTNQPIVAQKTKWRTGPDR